MRWNAMPKTMSGEFNIQEMMTVTAELTRILSEETELLRRMKIREILPLQEEKRALSSKLEHFQQLLVADNSTAKAADETTRDKLLTMTDYLAVTIEENMHHTHIAQQVNQRVLQTITEAMASQQRPVLYGRDGKEGTTGPEVMVSVNLNERA